MTSIPPYAGTLCDRFLAAGQFAEAAVEFVRSKDRVTFPALAKALEPFMVVAGDATLALAGNAVVWANMSDALCGLIANLIEKKCLFLHPSSLVEYLNDGEMLALPMTGTNEEYADPHWCPAVLRVVPTEIEKARDREKLEIARKAKRAEMARLRRAKAAGIVR